MMRNTRVSPLASFGSLAVLAILALAGCTDTETVYVDREPFNPPPDSTNGFLGYYSAEDKLTTCGNCHVTFQGQWEETAHADAYNSLVNSGSAQDACYSCHTVSENGNEVGAIPASGGWNVVEDEAYHDVQCESCHGPGLEHVEAPDAGTEPLAHAGMATQAASCAACHSGEHQPFAEQWAETGHADLEANEEPGTNVSSGCVSCHEGKVALRRFAGDDPDFVEKSTGERFPPAVCTTCHDPHGSPNSKMLRAPIDVPELTVNLCMQCHFRGTKPGGSFSNSTATTTKRGAHAAQGAVLLGEQAGYIPRGFVYDTNAVHTTHASTANPRLCAGCHVSRFTVEDENGFVFQSTGHLFQPDPCLDAEGLPVKDNSCEYTSTARNWSSCTASGCHASADVAVSLFLNQRQNVQNLVDQLWTDDGTLNTGGEPYMDPATDTGDLVTVLAANPTVDGIQAFNANDTTVSPAEGALWNAMMLAEHLYDHNDGSKGVHNPFFYEALLAASIQEVQDVYAAVLPAAPSPTVKALMEKALSRPGVRYISGQVKISAAR